MPCATQPNDLDLLRTQTMKTMKTSKPRLNDASQCHSRTQGNAYARKTANGNELPPPLGEEDSN